MERTSFDVIIIGGGMAGQSLACVLGGACGGPALDVALIDANPLARQAAPKFDGRASAIAPSSRNMLATLGVWSKIERWVQPITGMVITDSRLDADHRPDLLRFDAPDASGALAYMIENRRLVHALSVRLADFPSIEVIAPALFDRLETTPDEARVWLADGQVLTARLVVAADGRRSKTRAAAGLKTIGWQYTQSGIVTTVKHERPHNGQAVQHFLPAGPFAILPLTDDRSSLVWTERTDQVERIMTLDDAGFLDELKRRFTNRLGALELASGRWSYPLSIELATSYRGERVVLIGDAAHGIHPIAGLGLNLGLRDVAALGEIVLDNVRLGLDFGGVQALETYQSWRRFDNFSTALLCDGLNRLFSSDVVPVRRLRDLGLDLVDRLEPVKRFFGDKAAATGADQPKLLRGEML
jgi:2-octaprenyl-6-methoxyphenol hydroxylase